MVEVRTPNLCLFKCKEFLSLGHAMWTVGGVQQLVGYGSARGTHRVWRLLCLLLVKRRYLAPQDYDLRYVAGIAPCDQTCYVAVVLLYGAVQTLLGYPFVQVALCLQGVVQMCPGVDHRVMLHYGRVKPPSERFDGLAAVCALHIVGIGQSTQQCRLLM